MSRFFVEISYKGTSFHGWQKQPGQITLQEIIEDALSLILREKIEVAGCGRTDTGVHAKQYYFHFDFHKSLSRDILKRINKVLSNDIAVKRIFPVSEEVHARFDAIRRSYEYHIIFKKNPFLKDCAWFFPLPGKLDIKLLNQASSVLLEYEDFFPFCKTKTDVKTMRCNLSKALWEEKENGEFVFYITSDRFLRGMVRLIVGMCVNYSMGKISLQEVKEAMDMQIQLKKSYSVPAKGLFLSEVAYDWTLII